jgi:hypothetical protein
MRMVTFLKKILGRSDKSPIMYEFHRNLFPVRIKGGRSFLIDHLPKEKIYA